jgi:CBS domain-containing protein
MFNTYCMSQIMTPMLVTIRPDDHLHRAEHLLRKYGIRQLPVIVDRNELVAMSSERDLHLAVHFRYPYSLKVFDLMKEHPYCVAANSYASDALKWKANFKAEAIAVTTGRRTLQGIFTRHDILRLMNRMSDSRVPLQSAA